MSNRPSGLGRSAPNFAQGMSLAFEFVGAVFLFWFVGRLVDNRFNSEPWFQLGGALIGWAGGFMHVYYRSKGAAWQGVPGTRRPAQAANKGTDAKGTADNGDGLGGEK